MKSSLVLCLVSLSLVMPAHADFSGAFQLKWRGSGGWGDKSAYCALFDTKTVETVRGSILSIDSVTPLPGMSQGVQLQLKTDKEIVSVHLGPRWYLENQDIDLQPQDKVEIIGSRIHCEGQSVMAAAEVRKGSQIIKLRDAQGHPLWTATPHQ